MKAKRGELEKGIWTGLVALLLVLGFVGIALGQSPTGTLTGTVTDAQGAAMVGATVTVHNADTGVDQKPIASNESGIYTATLLPPGNYDVTVSQTGFATVQRKGVAVQVGSTVRIDIQMPVAGQQSLVTVTAEAPLIETEKTDASQTVSENLVSNLPTSSRRWEQFALLTPGINFDGNSGGLTVHGINSLYNNNAVDGADNNGEFFGTARGVPSSDGYVYSADAIREFQVATGNFSAETGSGAGAVVNAVTKSGTSSFHGDVFYNMRNPIFNAVDPAAQAKPVHQQNQFGGSAGGPLLKNKLFYFINYDGFRKSTPITYTSSTPVGSLTCPSPATVTTAQCAAAINQLLTGELGTFPRLLRQDVALGKLDYQLNEANHLNATFNWRNWQEPNGAALSSSNNSGLGSQLDTLLFNRFLIANWTHVIGTNKVNEFLFQYGIDKAVHPPRADTTVPNVVLSNIVAYGNDIAHVNVQPDEHRTQIADTFSFTHGPHSFKAGVNIQSIFQSSRSGTGASGDYVYSTAVALPAAVTAGGGCTPTVSAISQTTNTIFCDWLVDLYGVNTGANTGQHYTSFSQIRDVRFPGNSNGVPIGFVDAYRHGQYSAYFQDDWKFRHNVTVNLGLRYDVQVLPPETNPNMGTPLLTYYETKIPTDYTGFQPRVGIAWNFAKNAVLRLGGGLFYGNTEGTIFSGARRSTGNREGTITCGPGSGLCTSLAFPSLLYSQSAIIPSDFTFAGLPASQEPVPALVLNPPGDPCLVVAACSVRALDPALVQPRVIEGIAALQWQLPGGIAFTANYNLTRGYHLPTPYDSNIAPSTVTKTYDVVNAAGATQFSTTVPFFTTRLDPAGPILAHHSVVNSWYNGMDLTVQKRPSHGVEFLANYTLSYATDDGEGNVDAGEGSFSGAGVLDPYNFKLEQGRSGLDVRNRFSGTVVWTPTFGAKLSNRFGRTLVEGWSLSGIETAANGSPYPAAIITTAIQCSDARTPNTAGACPATTVGAVTIPAGVSGLDNGMTGTALAIGSAAIGGRATFLPRAAANLPSYYNLDARLSRQVSISERFKAEIRAEMFNSFNHTQVQGVNTGAYTLVQPSATSTTCNIATHGNTCVVPSATWGVPTVTSTNLLGARQVQFGFRLEF